MRRHALILVATLAFPSIAFAQPVGTFRWQLDPFCNVVTFNIAQQDGDIYTVDGFDDQCGAGPEAPALGTATVNADGTLAIGFHLVSSPDATPAHVLALLPKPLKGGVMGGKWRDSAGHVGKFVPFSSSSPAPGTPRPAGSIGATSVDPAQVQLRIDDSCPNGQVMRAVNQDGSVECIVVTGQGTITAVHAGDGLVGGGIAGAVALALRQNANGAFDLSNDKGLFALGAQTPGVPAPLAGAGGRFAWHANKDALRAGRVNGAQWDDDSVGRQSFAGGQNTVARGVASFAMGNAVQAFGDGSVALGSFAIANGGGSFVFADTSTPGVAVAGTNQFVARAAGGVRFFSNSTLSTGVVLPPQASAWSSLSDVNEKQDFRDFDDAELLGKIARMPVREWSYKAQGASIRHAGPTAQDFHAAFGLGEDVLRISTIDADGIALAGVKALEARTRAMAERADEERAALRAEIAALRAEIERLTALRR